jgi:glucose/arabinose dehydrogenase
MSGTVFLASNAYSVHEQDGFVTIKVTRTGDTSAAVNVSFASHDMSATNGADYTRVEGVATIAAGETSASIDIPIINDGLSEATETFSISIESISSGTLLFPRTATVKILDDENPATEPPEPPLVSDYDVNVDTVIVFPTIDPTYAYQPMSIVWLPGQDDLALVAHKKGQISVVNTATGAVADDLLIDLRDEVNSNSDRGLMDIVIHPDFENHPYLYAFYVVDPPGSAGTGGNAGEDGDGNRYAHVVRWELDLSGDTPTLVPGSKTVIVGAGGQSLADVSGNGLIDSTLAENIDLPSSEIDPDTGEYKQDFIKVDSITHAGGALAFGPDGMLYVSVGDGASFNLMDPRAQSVQDVDSLSGKILRIDPITGKGLADNPFADPGDLDANASKVWMLGLRNPFTMTFADDGRLFMSETGWYTYEEINVGGAGANFGWPFFEGADLGHLYPTPDYADLPSAADFYDQVNAGNIVITPAYRSFSHFEEDPGFHVNAIVGAS